MEIPGYRLVPPRRLSSPLIAAEQGEGGKSEQRNEGVDFISAPPSAAFSMPDLRRAEVRPGLFPAREPSRGAFPDYRKNNGLPGI